MVKYISSSAPYTGAFVITENFLFLQVTEFVLIASRWPPARTPLPPPASADVATRATGSQQPQTDEREPHERSHSDDGGLAGAVDSLQQCFLHRPAFSSADLRSYRKYCAEWADFFRVHGGYIVNEPASWGSVYGAGALGAKAP
ncbi:hypothetical protein V5799_026450 [Amblyomma americanum]|uniref:Uncharacterized protein n=1 Tax=Amblyomma americanum TaxID=6943 RepID=A0AAQ4DII7_AMBAM